MTVNILKDNNYINYDTYEKIMISEQYNKLNNLQKKENKKKLKIQEDKRFYNLSLKKIGKNFSQTMLVIVNELTIFVYQKDKNINQLMLIFTKDDRLIYLGFLLFLISLCLYFIDLTN